MKMKFINRDLLRSRPLQAVELAGAGEVDSADLLRADVEQVRITSNTLNTIYSPP